jgi:hypothetical protein
MSQGTPSARLHHIDALRAFAMLLGIGLHVALAYGGTPWIVMDQAREPFFRWFFEIIHGFRMQLFFFVSGYFTMLLWRRRGLSQLLEQRFQRVFVPFLLGYFFIVPIMQRVTIWTLDNVPNTSVKASAGKSELVEAIRKGDLAMVQEITARGSSLDEPDKEFGIPPLGWAALYGNVDIARLLIDAGANVNERDRNGYRPLHSAAFLGRSKVFDLLLERGAEADAVGTRNDTCRDSAATETGTTLFIATAVRIPLTTLMDLSSGRKQCMARLDQYEQERGQSWLKPVQTQVKQWRDSYREWIAGSFWNVKMNFVGPQVHLINSSQFAHLWFLWFLCWYLCIFALIVLVLWYLPLPHIPAFLTLSRFRLLWLLPITLIPQLFMGGFGATIGPDTAIGVIPPPHLLLYYGVFFFVGVAYFDSKDQCGCLGSWWWMWLPIAGGTFWMAKETLGNPITSGFYQVFFTWSMIYGLMGLFHTLLSREYRLIRYFSDSAYWLYLAHLPLVLALQSYAREWPYSAWQKFLIVNAITVVVLLLSYQLLVRHSYLGTILNGPRARKHAEPTAEPAATEPK